MTTPDQASLRRALDELLVAAQNDELTPVEFELHLDSISETYLGSEAQDAEAQERRDEAVTAYRRLAEQKDMQRHHHLERLVQALDGIAQSA